MGGSKHGRVWAILGHLSTADWLRTIAAAVFTPGAVRAMSEAPIWSLMLVGVGAGLFAVSFPVGAAINAARKNPPPKPPTQHEAYRLFIEESDAYSLEARDYGLRQAPLAQDVWLKMKGELLDWTKRGLRPNRRDEFIKILDRCEATD